METFNINLIGSKTYVSFGPKKMQLTHCLRSELSGIETKVNLVKGLSNELKWVEREMKLLKTTDVRFETWLNSVLRVVYYLHELHVDMPNLSDIFVFENTPSGKTVEFDTYNGDTATYNLWSLAEKCLDSMSTGVSLVKTDKETMTFVKNKDRLFFRDYEEKAVNDLNYLLPQIRKVVNSKWLQQMLTTLKGLQKEVIELTNAVGLAELNIAEDFENTFERRMFTKFEELVHLEDIDFDMSVLESNEPFTMVDLAVCKNIPFDITKYNTNNICIVDTEYIKRVYAKQHV